MERYIIQPNPEWHTPSTERCETVLDDMTEALNALRKFATIPDVTGVTSEHARFIHGVATPWINDNYLSQGTKHLDSDHPALFTRYVTYQETSAGGNVRHREAIQTCEIDADPQTIILISPEAIVAPYDDLLDSSEMHFYDLNQLNLNEVEILDEIVHGELWPLLYRLEKATVRDFEAVEEFRWRERARLEDQECEGIS